jgi:hypothetical protein
MTVPHPLPDPQCVAVALKQAYFTIVANMPQRHSPTPHVVVDLPLDPPTPSGIGQRDSFCVNNPSIVFDPKVLDQPDPPFAIFHGRQSRSVNRCFPPNHATT